MFDAQGIGLLVSSYDPNENLEAIRYQGLTEQIDRFAPGFIKRLDRKMPGEVQKPANWDDENTLHIVTEPVNPPSNPPYNALLDADGDRKNDKKYRSDDSPVD